jgi:DNA-binding beta-propeller fold protein YncE
VSVIQTSDHTVIKQVGPASLAQQNLAITPDGQFVYTIGNTQFVQVISTATITPVATITMNQANFGTDIVIAPDSSYVYVPGAQTSIGNGALNVIETASQTVIARVPLGGTPKYAAISPDGAKVYVANFNTVDVVQTSDNSLVSKVNTGGNSASGVAVVDIY